MIARSETLYVAFQCFGLSEAGVGGLWRWVFEGLIACVLYDLMEALCSQHSALMQASNSRLLEGLNTSELGKLAASMFNGGPIFPCQHCQVILSSAIVLSLERTFRWMLRYHKFHWVIWFRKTASTAARQSKYLLLHTPNYLQIVTSC